MVLSQYQLLFKNIYLFIYSLIFGCIGSSLLGACGLSLVVVSRGYSSLGCVVSHCGGFSCCGARALGTRASVVVAHGL